MGLPNLGGGRRWQFIGYLPGLDRGAVGARAKTGAHCRGWHRCGGGRGRRGGHCHRSHEWVLILL